MKTEIVVALFGMNQVSLMLIFRRMVTDEQMNQRLARHIERYH